MPITKHGKSHTRLYHIWNAMKQRCSNPKAISYKYYGEKGVAVCKEWQEFNPFYEWAMTNGYKADLSIDRINRDGNYCPENCRWATIKEQQNNTSYNKLFTYNGETLTIKQWAEKTGVYPNMLYKRLKRGWDISKALNTKSLMKWGKQHE